MRKGLIFIAAILTASSCIYDYTPKDTLDATGKVVIDGDIIIGEICSFNVGTVQKYAPAFSEETISALFKIEDEHGNVYLPSSNDYVSQASIDLRSAPLDRKYHLVADIKDADSHISTYASSWLMPEPEPEVTYKDSVLKSRDNNGKEVPYRIDYYLNISAPNSSGCYKWDWVKLMTTRAMLVPPLYEYDANNEAVLYKGDSWWDKTYCYEERKSRTSSVFIAKALTDYEVKDHYGFSLGPYEMRNCAAFKLIVCAITEEAYQFLDAINGGSDGNGSILSPVPGEAVGNIVNVNDPSDRAVGFISVCRGTVLTLKKYTEPVVNEPQKAEAFIKNPLAGLTEGETEQSIYKKWYYDKDYIPFDSPDNWVPRRCVDCESWPGSGKVTAPEGWDINKY